MVQPDSDPFDPAELRAWERDPRGAPFWAALVEMGNRRMSGVRRELKVGQHNLATHLAGELEAIDEVRQLVDVIIQEYRDDQENQKEPA